jgi:hypothetical protein
LASKKLGWHLAYKWDINGILLEYIWHINGIYMEYSNGILLAGWWFQPTPLKNDGVSSSVGMMTFPTEWKKHVPNHQLDYNRKYLTSQSPVKSKITIQYEHYEHIQYYNSILQLYTNGITNTRYYNYSIYQ